MPSGLLIAAALDNGSINSSPTAATGAALYNPYLAAQGRVGTPGTMTGAMGNPSDVHQVLAALAAATTSPAIMKDSRWLTLEVCRQYQRKMCSRDENECKFAHPPPHVDVQNGRVICCYDSIKGKCQRHDPPCKYFHPPQHLRELLLQNGRNNLILKNMQLQLLQQQIAQGAMLPGLSAAIAAAASANAASSVAAAAASTAGNVGTPVTSTSLGPTLSQTTPSPTQPSQQTTPQSLSAVAALTANLDTPVTNPLAQVFTAQPKTPFIDPLCAGLYGQAPIVSPGGTRKRTANESFYTPIFTGSSMLNYGAQLNPAIFQQIGPNALGVSLSPYLTPTQINSMAAAVASAAPLKSVPSTVPLANGGAPGTPGGLTAAHLAALATAAMNPMGALATPAKRPALADAKSGLPMFDYGQGMYAIQTQIQNAKNGIQQQTHPAMSPQLTPHKLPGSNSQDNGNGVENGASNEETGGQKNQLAASSVGQFYPETYIEVPHYVYL
nr:muscleblind protein [Hymenolepis microstoma]